MKLITLNTWGGVLNEPLIDFIKKYSNELDIFCFQEIFDNTTTSRPLLGKIQPNLFSDIKNILSDFNGHHTPAQESDVGGLAIFIKKTFIVNKIKNVIIFPELNKTENENDDDYFSMGRNLQCMEFINSEKIYTILNFHGMWVAKGKIDTDKRIEQSEKLKKIFKESKGARILCGDFNQIPDTKSMSILNEGNRNLIQEYNINSTRSSFYKKPIRFSDYVIISFEIEVKDFKVLQEEVSDHLPLFLEFN